MKVKIIQMAGGETDIITLNQSIHDDPKVLVTPEKVKLEIFNLIETRNWVPFEFGKIWIEIEAPIYVMQQWREMGGAWTAQLDLFDGGDIVYEEVKMPLGSLGFNVARYKEMVKDGESTEQARKILPLSTYARSYWNPSIRNLLRFFRIYLNVNTENPIRDLALSLFRQFANFYPNICEAFYQYELGTQNLSVKQLSELVTLIEKTISVQDVTIEIEEVLEIAKARTSLVREIFERVSPEVGDSTKDSTSSESAPSDGTKTC